MTSPTPFAGLLAYLITPLGPAGAPAPDVLARLVGDAVRAGVDGVTVRASSGAGTSFSPGERGDVVAAAVDAASDAWHTGVAGLVPAEYAALRQAHVDRRPLDAVVERSWLLALARELAALRPVAGLHALAGLLDVPTGPPRGPALATPTEQTAGLRAVLARRPAAGSAETGTAR